MTKFVAFVAFLLGIIGNAHAVPPEGDYTFHWRGGDEILIDKFGDNAFGDRPLSVLIRFTVPGPDWTGTLFSLRAKQGKPSMTVTAFRYEPFGERFIGFAMDGISPGSHEAGAKTVRDNVVGGHLIAAFTRLGPGLDAGEHLLVVRVSGEVSELFIDGKLLERRSSVRGVPRTYMQLFHHMPDGWRVGSDPNGGNAFAGGVDQVSIWPFLLSDDQVRALSGGTFSAALSHETPANVVAQALFQNNMSDENRMQSIDAAMPSWLVETLRRDKWFPRYHPAVPAGLIFDTRCAIYAGRFHLFPGWLSDFNLLTETGSAFRMQHLSSSDLVHWKIEPFPIRLSASNVLNGSTVNLMGSPHFFFLRFWPNGAPHHAVPLDDMLKEWKLPESQPVITREGDGYRGRFDCTVFQHGDDYFLTGTRKNRNKLNMAMPLYRSKDLANWEFVGTFYQSDRGKPFNECPQIFSIDGKMVVTAFYPMLGQTDYGDNVLVGHFDGTRFLAESSQRFDYGGHGHSRSFDADMMKDGRVIGWSSISVYADNDAIAVARSGWKGMRSIPREVSLRADNTLKIEPTREIESLRVLPGVITPLGKMEMTLPQNHNGQFEVSATLAEGGAITFATSDGSCTLSIDASERVLVFDQSVSPKNGSDHGHIFRTPRLCALDHGPVQVRVFFDRSVFEVYVDGHVITSRYFSNDPAGMTATRNAETKSITVWKMGTIWSEFISGE